MSSTMSMRDSMSATRVLFINNLEKEGTHGRQCYRDNQEKPYGCIRIDPVSKEDRCRQYNHSQVDDNERYKSWMSSDPRNLTAGNVHTSFICLFKSEMIPEHSQKNCLENSDCQRSRSEYSKPSLLHGNMHSISVYSNR